MTNAVHKDIRVQGKVQGVFFRVSACRKAEEFGITGRVRNLSDGSVFLEAEGTEELVKAFMAWCENGPPGAMVAGLSVQDGTLLSYTDFRILRD